MLNRQTSPDLDTTTTQHRESEDPNAAVQERRRKFVSLSNESFDSLKHGATTLGDWLLLFACWIPGGALLYLTTRPTLKLVWRGLKLTRHSAKAARYLITKAKDRFHTLNEKSKHQLLEKVMDRHANSIAPQHQNQSKPNTKAKYQQVDLDTNRSTLPVEFVESITKDLYDRLHSATPPKRLNQELAGSVLSKWHAIEKSATEDCLLSQENARQTICALVGCDIYEVLEGICNEERLSQSQFVTLRAADIASQLQISDQMKINPRIAAALAIVRCESGNSDSLESDIQHLTLTGILTEISLENLQAASLSAISHEKPSYSHECAQGESMSTLRPPSHAQELNLGSIA